MPLKRQLPSMKTLMGDKSCDGGSAAAAAAADDDDDDEDDDDDDDDDEDNMACKEVCTVVLTTPHF